MEAGRLDTSYLDTAAELLSDPEPSLRHYPMPRWLLGAYEPLDDAFSHLEGYGLAVMRRTPGGRRNQFFMLCSSAGRPSSKVALVSRCTCTTARKAS